MFTDGVSEAFDDAGQEFGQEGLAAAVTNHREKSPKRGRLRFSRM